MQPELPALLAKGASPAALYLARLSPGSRPAQAHALRVLADLLSPGLAPDSLLWHAVLPEQAVALRARLAADYAPATARRMLAAFRGVIQEAWRQGRLTAERRERLTDLAPIRGRRTPPGRCLSPAEVDDLYRAAGARDRALLGVLLQGGLRRAEAAGLQGSEVPPAVPRPIPPHGGNGTVGRRWADGTDDERGQCYGASQPSSRGVSSGPGGSDAELAAGVGSRLRGGGAGEGPPNDPPLVSLRVLGKGGKERTVYLAGRAARDLSAFLTQGVGCKDGPLFGLRTGAGVWFALRRLARRAGVTNLSPHDLRRTYASRALGAGVDLATVQASMGHADPRTTARYDRRGDDALRAAAESVARSAG